MKIAAIGEAMIELSMVGDVPQIGVAGDTLNTAIYLKRTAPDLTVDYVTRLGGDAFSQRIADFIAAQGIGTDAIERDADKTCGLYGITTDAAGERTFTYWRNQSAARSVFSGPAGPSFDWLSGYDVIYLSGISLAILPPQTRDALLHWLSIYRTQGRRVVYDSNYRPALWPDQATAQAVTRSMWHMCDIALPSQDDEAAIFGETLEAVAARFVGMGKTGALKRAVTDGSDKDARWNMMMASYEGALAFTKGLGSVHALSHAAGRLKEKKLHHGTLNAIFLPHLLRFNEGAAPEKYERLRFAMGLASNADLGDAIARLNEDLGIPSTLSAIGVETSDGPGIVEFALNDLAHRGNARPADQGDYERIYEQAL